MTRQFKIAATAVLIIASIDLACGSESSPTQAICVVHAGDSDKPVIGLAIGTSDVGVQLCRKDSEERVGLPIVSEHVIDSKLLLRLITIVEGTRSDQEERPHEFGTLLVVIIKDNDRRVLVLNRAHSMKLLGELKRSCGDRTLRLDLAHLLDRITY
jgi:hypothetical protein